ncbi:hypothetical protein [Bradyrhizobium lablabi]|uniref:hypothetical protein n=1 Tax=Bradyrhizobium lablabi TaxID=722472 RepID=UPI002011065B|nr:hypothetical protein [Bradyrhizobium lablabi]
MAHRGFRASNAENVFGLPRLPSPNTGVQALDLVYQAAEVFRSIEAKARDTELRVEAAERAQRELIANTERKLKDATRALEEAQKRFEAQQEALTAIERRAQAAEDEAREARQTLALVEEAIRRRLLFTSGEADGRMTAVA